MSRRNRKEFWLSEEAGDQGSRPNSANASGRSTPDPYYNGRRTVDPRFSGQPDHYEQRITGPDRSQRSHVSQYNPYPSLSSQPTPSRHRITGPYRGQPILEATSSGHSGPYSSSQPTVDPHFWAQTNPDPRPSGSSTPKPQRIPEPYPGGRDSPHPRLSGQTTYDPRPSGQRTPNPRTRNQPTPEPQTSGQSAPNQQYITNPDSGGQRILEPNSSGQSISDGIYIITNEYHHRFVYLEDPNGSTPLKGHFRRGNRNAQWHVKNYGNEQYSIWNVEYKRYADSGNLAVVKAHVEGSSEERLWRIQGLTTGEFTIATTDTRNLWMLPSDIADTPVELSNVYTDRRCWWTFTRSEIGALVNEHTTTNPPTLFDPTPPLVPSGGQPTPDAAIVEFTSVIAGALDLLPPLRGACEALRVVLQRAETIGHINEDQEALVKRLKFHLATVENDLAKLEEDQNIDKIIPVLNQDVRESLETYARELKESCELLSENQPGILADKTLKIDEAFQRYTDVLHQFAANTVAQMQQQLAQFGQEFQQGAHIAAERARPNRANAYGVQHRECLQGTRTKTLPAISDWVDDENAGKWIFFFLDVAGSGKSTVAKHMAEKWEREERLLARFFFSRDTTETMSTNSFCSTVASAFSALDATYKEHTDKFMKLPNVELLSFEKRFEGMVVGPLRAIGRPAILIVDALDECHPEQRNQLLQALRDQHSAIPFLRILATGRPERDIKRWANDEFGFGYKNFILLEKSDKDVELYIKHTLKDLPIVQDRLYPVIHRAEGLFIWARIACDLLLDSDDVDGLLDELGKEVSLDYLYKVALEQSMPKEGASRRAMVLVLQMILAAMEPLSIAELEMLSPKPGVVDRIVTRLGSVLLYQGREDPIRLLHATFREFLITRSKADSFFIQPELGHHTLTSGCLTIISDRSKQDDPTLQGLDAISQRKEVSFEQDTY